MTQRALRLVVAGTGTGVGKTHVACALLRMLTARGIEAVGLKPVETGVTPSPELNGGHEPATLSDAERLRRAGGTFHVKRSPCSFVDPVSPHLAARRVGERIEVPAIERWVGEHAARVILVETAGG
ncbi:MAG TPA: ATP-dependent dethiobiotin synthetase BioD, partial [Polyangiaceae bacterium]